MRPIDSWEAEYFTAIVRYIMADISLNLACRSSNSDQGLIKALTADYNNYDLLTDEILEAIEEDWNEDDGDFSSWNEGLWNLARAEADRRMRPPAEPFMTVEV